MIKQKREGDEIIFKQKKEVRNEMNFVQWK